MKNKIIWKFWSAYIILILITITVLNFFVSLKLRDYYEQKITDKLKSNTILVADILKEVLINEPELADTRARELADKLNLRITIVDTTGKVLADSQKDAQIIENHNTRPEIIDAVAADFGESTRFSQTVGFNMKYVAKAVKTDNKLLGTVRLALPLSEIEQQIRVIYNVVLLGGIVASIIAFLIAYFISKGITSPITEMTDIAGRIAQEDFSKRARVSSGDELGLLARSLNKMADELQSKMENLKKMDNIRTDFVANVSHELKTPLTSIKGFVETLEDGAIDDKENAKKFLAIIKKHTERINAIINDLLSLSELELGQDRLNRKDFDLKSLFNEVLMGFEHALSAKKHTLDVDYQGNVFNIKADKEKIEQIFVNLLDNAIKYTKDNGKINVFVQEEEKELLIQIQDNGVGIPEEHRIRIFERFYRADKARSRQLGGTGLGLAIVKHIVSLHKGAIKLESQLNKGTKVSIILPKI